MIEFIKRLFKREPQPDVLLVDDNGSISLHVSRIVARRRVVDYSGGVLMLGDEGKVRGSHWVKTWEEL
jgi:hypothetical protein